jgi:hypothetical protein
MMARRFGEGELAVDVLCAIPGIGWWNAVFTSMLLAFPLSLLLQSLLLFAVFATVLQSLPLFCSLGYCLQSLALFSVFVTVASARFIATIDVDGASAILPGQWSLLRAMRIR